jgi:hypothetical protein
MHRLRRERDRVRTLVALSVLLAVGTLLSGESAGASAPVSLQTWAWVYGNQFRTMVTDYGAISAARSPSGLQAAATKLYLDATAAGHVPGPAGDAKPWRSVQQDLLFIAKNVVPAAKDKTLRKKVARTGDALGAAATSFTRPFFARGYTVGGFESQAAMFSYVEEVQSGRVAGS